MSIEFKQCYLYQHASPILGTKADAIHDRVYTTIAIVFYNTCKGMEDNEVIKYLCRIKY